MTTREFFEMAASHLTPHGVLTINVGRAPADRSLINGLATTLATVFPSVYMMDIPGTLNSMIYATMQPTTPEDFSSEPVAPVWRPKHASPADPINDFRLCQPPTRL